MQREEIERNHIKYSIATRGNRKTREMDKTKIQQIENSYEHGRY